MKTDLERPTPKLFVGRILAVAALFGASSLAYPWTLLDSPLCVYIGRTILEGAAPYRDAWDVRAPGVFFAYALQLFLLGNSAVSLRLFDLVWQFFTALTLASISVRMFQRQAVGLIAATAYLVVYFSQNYWNWAEPDTFLSLPLAVSFWFALRGLEGGRGVHWGLAGLFTGVAALFKLPYGSFGVGLMYAAATKTRGDMRGLFKYLLAMGMGLLAPFALCGVYFYFKGVLRDFLISQFVFAPAYLERIHAVIPAQTFLWHALRPVLVPLYVLGAVGLGWLVLSVVREKRIGVPQQLLLAWLAISVLAVFLHGSFLGYHYLTLVAPLAVLGAHSISVLYAEYRAHRGWWPLLGLIFVGGALVVPVEKFRQHAVFTWESLAGPPRSDPWRELGNYIRQRTRPEEKILVWGNAPVVYLYAERKAASRFLCTAYLMVPTRGVDYKKTFLAELAANNPAYVVLAKKGSVTPGLSDSLASFEQFTELKSFVAAKYRTETKTDEYVLFRLREDSQPSMRAGSRPNK